MKQIRNQAMLLLLIVVMGLGLVTTAGCNKWKLAVVAYEGVGEVLGVVKTELETLNEQGKLKQEDYEKMAVAYNTAADMYVSAGKVMKEAMDIEDTVQQARRLEDYFALIGEIRKFVTEFTGFLKAGGIDTKKVDAIVDKYSAGYYRGVGLELPV